METGKAQQRSREQTTPIRCDHQALLLTKYHITGNADYLQCVFSIDKWHSVSALVTDKGFTKKISSLHKRICIDWINFDER